MSIASVLHTDRSTDAAEWLGDIAEELAEASDEWAGRVRHDPRRRFFERIEATDDYDAWVVGWAPGQGVPAHQHGDSSGVLLITEGRLLEVRFPPDGQPTVSVRVAGDLVVVDRDVVHALTNVNDAVATSIHVYSPPLQAMEFIDVEQPGGPRLRTESVGLWSHTSHPSTIEAVLHEARRRLHRLEPEEAHAAWRGSALLVDIRPERDRRAEGTIPGALIIERNELEWRLDPASPDRIPEADRHDREIVVVCNAGYASSLTAAALQDLGLVNATDLIGGFRAWRLAGLPVLRSLTV